ncbi:MAG TPA: hypothetical protein DCE41_08195 [Cytophagales bacterium]|nr:hypothetical protein [Cytophagales bacterium]
MWPGTSTCRACSKKEEYEKLGGQGPVQRIPKKVSWSGPKRRQYEDAFSKGVAKRGDGVWWIKLI